MNSITMGRDLIADWQPQHRAWKKLGRQTKGDVVKRREFRIDPASANGLLAIAGE